MKKVLVSILIIATAICFTACTSDNEDNNSSTDNQSVTLGINDILDVPNPADYGKPQDTLGEDGKSISDKTWKGEPSGKTSDITLYCTGKCDEEENGYETNTNLHKKKLGEITYYFDESSDEVKDKCECAYFIAKGYNFQVEITDNDDGKLTNSERRSFKKWLKKIKVK